MKVKNRAIAGTLESSDAFVTIEPATSGVNIEIESAVFAQYGKEIERTAKEVLEKLEIKDAKLFIKDQGALNCTIKARIQTAVLRAHSQTKNIDWGGTIS